MVNKGQLLTVDQGENTGGVAGYVYLLHFDQPLAHARHYIGFTTDIDGRLRRHERGGGSCLIAAIAGRNIGYIVARVWRGDGNFERKLKRQKNGPRLCPICERLRNERKASEEIKTIATQD